MKFVILTLLLVTIPVAVLTIDCHEDGIFDIGCKTFVRCKDGVSETVECEEGYVYNSKIQDCDLMENVDTICGKYVDCSNLSDGHYPNYSTGCTTFFTCDSGIFHNHNYCPSGLVFDMEEDRCDWPRNVYQPCGEIPRPNKSK